MSTERRQQIIEATIRCIGLYGIAGATLDKIAEECGMSRGHVRHFIGNRDDLLVETTRQFYFGNESDGSLLPEGVEGIDQILDYLFGDEFTHPDADNSVVLGLVEASRTNHAIAEVMLRAYEQTQTVIAAAIAERHPASDPAKLDEVSFGVMTLSLGNVFMSDLEVSAARTTVARRIAEGMIAEAVVA
ncbi:TetR/AcrR family transcriptional regulator [Subtercola sp. YIM 133946]|uniref:TetR/AcrR family transcriptional regulator n=1 Tax=Subtercola sp. YIM 133946 TaxID=3118909 RepID=UPI002F946183